MTVLAAERPSNLRNMTTRSRGSVRGAGNNALATLGPRLLTFASEAVGSSSASQTAKVTTLSSGAALSAWAIKLTGAGRGRVLGREGGIVTSTATQAPAVGPEGPPGPLGNAGTGTNGALGPQGPQGAKGPQGATGSQSRTGATEPQRPAGPQGLAGAAAPTMIGSPPRLYFRALRSS